MKKQILKDYTPAFSLSHLQSLNDKTPARPGQDLYKNSRINSTKNTN